MSQKFEIILSGLGKTPETNVYTSKSGNLNELLGGEFSNYIHSELKEVHRVYTIGEFAEWPERIQHAKFLARIKDPHSSAGVSEYQCIANLEKGEYVDLNDYLSLNSDANGGAIDPLFLLTAVGNGSGTDDYTGLDSELVGKWAGSAIVRIPLEKCTELNLTKLSPRFEV